MDFGLFFVGSNWTRSSLDLDVSGPYVQHHWTYFGPTYWTVLNPLDTYRTCTTHVGHAREGGATFFIYTYIVPIQVHVAPYTRLVFSCD
jgi:hypothetical protein